MTLNVKFGKQEDVSIRRDLQDNSVEYIVVGDKTVDRSIEISYSLELPIGNRAIFGTLYLVQEGSNIIVDNEYSFIPPLIESISYAGSFDGNDIVLEITTSGIGENPIFLYRTSKFEIL